MSQCESTGSACLAYRLSVGLEDADHILSLDTAIKVFFSGELEQLPVNPWSDASHSVIIACDSDISVCFSTSDYEMQASMLFGAYGAGSNVCSGEQVYLPYRTVV